jgi:hypothetical protein
MSVWLPMKAAEQERSWKRCERIDDRGRGAATQTVCRWETLSRYRATEKNAPEATAQPSQTGFSSFPKAVRAALITRGAGRLLYAP